MKYTWTTAIITIALCMLSPNCLGEDLKSLQALLKDGGLYAETADGEPLLNIRSNHRYIPASTIKLATAFCSLEELSNTHRFRTKIFTQKHSLYIQGFGDPSLVSEEIRTIVSHIAPHLSRIDRIYIDTSAFALNKLPDGTTNTLNPYDATNGAFIVNFGSARLARKSKHTVLSAEPQTPLTPLSKQFGLKIPIGKTDRINIASTPRLGARYGAEILVAMLKDMGIQGAMHIDFQATPSTAHLIYTHHSSQNLEQIAKQMLKYSTNFTANQLMLVLGAEKFGYPATLEKGQRALSECLKTVGWSDFHIEEGSGLSRKTRVSPEQLVRLIKHFPKYSKLLPEKMGFKAKTGSLREVNSLAGYFELQNQKRIFFAILINAKVPHLHKYTVAKMLRHFIQEKTSSHG
jgi:D-alanyl-D-alanine carboxypeptidase/D-alanyl-D-alanine-endopeptidase (penicillin-binding protein 4)